MGLRTDAPTRRRPAARWARRRPRSPAAGPLAAPSPLPVPIAGDRHPSTRGARASRATTEERRGTPMEPITILGFALGLVLVAVATFFATQWVLERRATSRLRLAQADADRIREEAET